MVGADLHQRHCRDIAILLRWWRARRRLTFRKLGPMQLAGVRAARDRLLPQTQHFGQGQDRWRIDPCRHEKLGRTAPSLFRSLQFEIYATNWNHTTLLARRRV